MGPCDCVETLIKRFQENPINTGRVDWLNCKKEFVADLIPPKIEFGAKPKYFIFIKGTMFSWIDGINFPRKVMRKLTSKNKHNCNYYYIKIKVTEIFN